MRKEDRVRGEEEGWRKGDSKIEKVCWWEGKEEMG